MHYWKKIDEKKVITCNLLELLENWLQNCFSCIKWTHVFLATYQIRLGVRQGSVLSPFLFNTFLFIQAYSVSRSE